jgi:conjugal transfer pilus assembly protein TrbC
MNILSHTLIVIVFFTLASSLGRAGEDYTAYAEAQAKKANEIITPYKAEVAELVKNILVKQNQEPVKLFKQELSAIALKQCTNLVKPDILGNSSDQASAMSILVFISFSMPMESIRGWIRQANFIGASVYLRGLVKNSFKDTLDIAQQLFEEDRGGMLIDPTIFTKYSILQVPAVVVQGGNDFDVIYGDVTLDYALENISKFGVSNQQTVLLQAIEKLRGKYRETKQ